MRENIVNKLTEGMQKLCAIANEIVAADGKVSSIEKDLLMQDLRELYDIALGIETGAAEPVAEPDVKAESIPSESEPEPEAEKPLFAPEENDEPETPVMAPVMEEIESNGNEKLFENDSLMVFEVDSATEPEPEPEPEPVEIPEPEPEPIEIPEPEPEKEQEPVAKPQPVEQPSLFDYLPHSEPKEQPAVRTIGETLNTGVSNLSEQLERRVMNNKVDDLRTIININDKFSFMSELFHNNMKAYNDFILRLNAIDSRDVAMEHVQEIARQYNWDNNSMAVMNFFKVFDRKF